MNILASIRLGGLLIFHAGRRAENRAKSQLAKNPDTEMADDKKDPIDPSFKIHESLMMILALCLFIWPWGSMDIASSVSQGVSSILVSACVESSETTSI
jgi:hypothetical protein